MTPQETNLAIAEVCGWTKCRLAILGAGGGTRVPTAHGVPPKRNYECSCPDYHGDLKAIQRAALDTFKDGQIVEFDNLLHAKQKDRGHWGVWQLTSADWCEAFLKVLEVVGVSTTTEVTPSQLQVLHSFGRGPQFRNHFCTGPGSTDYPDCMALTELGLMDRHPPTGLTGGDDCFVVTEEGKRVMSANSPPPPKKSRSAQRFERFRKCADCFTSFRAFLEYEKRTLSEK